MSARDRKSGRDAERTAEPSLGTTSASALFSRLMKQPPVPTPGTEPGRVVGDYRLLELIGQGGMGQVWAAEQTTLQRRVAVKFVRSDRVSAKQLVFFQREARAGGRLHHPGLVTVYAYGDDGGHAWIAMELVEGGWTLRDFVDGVARQPQVPADYDRETARLVAEVAEAMQAAHDAGVIHRDLKPQNVLIPADGHPKVGDFGLAKITDETALSQTGEFAGTYYYMSPEQVAARRMGIDHRADVFSLGVILYEMLALRRPFEGDTSHQVAAQILTKEPPDPRLFRSRIPRDLVVIAGRALEKDPDRRYPSMAAMAADLRRHLRGEAIRARPPGALGRASRWARRNPTRSLAVAFGALAIGLTAGFLIREFANQRALAEQGAALGRLYVAQGLDDLLIEADELWPVLPGKVAEYEAWLRDAGALVSGGGLLGQGGEARFDVELAALEARALPLTDEEREQDVRAHPRYLELVELRRKDDALQRAQRVRAGEASPAGFELGLEFSQDTERLALRALALAQPETREYGCEAQALAYARLALEHVEDDWTYGRALHALAWAQCANGLDQEALETAAQLEEFAGPLAPPTYQHEFEQRKWLAIVSEIEAGIASAGEELALVERERAELERIVSERRTWRFADERDAWWHARLSSIVGVLAALQAPTTGLLSEDPQAVDTLHGWSVPRRLELARRLAAAFAPGGSFDVRWQRALPEIERAYPGLDLPVQEGLVPLGPDPASGMWEFWHVQSGAEPARGSDGALRITPESGLVLVLLPGGRFLLGAQNLHEEDPRYDPAAVRYEAPVHEVELSPFFISKYELTQAQWKRLTGRTPSYWNPDSRPDFIGWTNPVEQVSWLECRHLLAQLGLELPSEAQWEYACRAGTDGPFSCPPDELGKHANLADQIYARYFVVRTPPELWEDGFAYHAPVGSLLPNAFGLHDVHGNVYEWCLDGYEAEGYEPGFALDPVQPPSIDGGRANRGSSYYYTSGLARCSTRDANPASGKDDDVGVRPARAIVR